MSNTGSISRMAENKGDLKVDFGEITVSRKSQEKKSGVYEQRITIKASDCDMFRRLRMSVLFRYLQEISIAHTEALGFTRETTLDKGALWVIARILVSLKRPLMYDEDIIIQTWPGEMMHVLFPRYYRIVAVRRPAAGCSDRLRKAGDMKKNDMRFSDGSNALAGSSEAEDIGQGRKCGSGMEEVGTGSALWSLIDAGTRRWIFPKTLGVIIPGFHMDVSIPLPDETAPLPEEQISSADKSVRSARFSEVDLNGHVNNTRYLDWMDDLVDEDFSRTHFADRIHVNFYREIHLGEEVNLRYIRSDDEFRMEGVTEGSRCFALECGVGKYPAPRGGQT